MTQRLHGNPADASTLPTNISAGTIAVPQASPPIQLNRWFRNGKHPNAEAQSRMAEHANSAALYRTKEVYASPPFVLVTGWPAASIVTNCDVARFAFHSGPYTRQLVASIVMNTPYQPTANSYMTLKIYSDAAMTTLVASQDFVYGVGANGSMATPQTVFAFMREIVYSMNISPDTDYYGVITASNYACYMCASIAESASLTQSDFGGYLAQNYTTHSLILACDRQNAETLCRSVWKRGGSKLFNFDITPGTSDPTDSYKTITTTSTTPTNVLDLTSTTFTSSAPPIGVLDGRYKNRIGQPNGTPCVMKAYGFWSTGAGGEVTLVNSAGTVIATINSFGSTASWQSTTFNLPSALDSYYLMFRSTAGGGARFHLYACSAWEQE